MDSYIERDVEVQQAVLIACAKGLEEKVADLAAFAIFEDGQNPHDLVDPIIKAGCKLEHGGHQLFEANFGLATYYFVGRKEKLLDEIRCW